jgi:hypothetical protein
MHRTKTKTVDRGTPAKPVTAKFIHSLRGTLKGKGVMKALMTNRRQERANPAKRCRDRTA